jgi:hypothetical protein
MIMDEYILDTSGNLFFDTKPLSISEEDSLVLWRALQMYQNAITSNSALADENDAERAELLQAKMIYLALEFAGTLDGRTFGDIYKEVSGT